MSKWLFSVEGKCPSRANMERDLNLFNAVRAGHAPGVLRIYDWDEPAVTIGHHQKHFSLFDTGLNLAILSRPTGGGAVLHGHDITYSLSVPETGLLSGGITESYACVSRIFCTALRRCGMDVEMKGESSRFSPVCFARSAPVELVCQGTKIMGLALLRREGYLLFQGVLPLQVDTGLAESAFGPGLAAGSRGLLDIMPGFDMDLFIGYLAEAFGSVMGVPLPLERNADNEQCNNRDKGKIYPRREER